MRSNTFSWSCALRLTAQAVEEGFTAFKSMAVPPTMPLEGTRPVRYAEACEALRLRRANSAGCTRTAAACRRIPWKR